MTCTFSSTEIPNISDAIEDKTKTLALYGKFISDIYENGALKASDEYNEISLLDVYNLSVKQLLDENYDDTFTALGYSDGDWAYDYSTVNFTSEKYSESVEVRVYEENETYSFTDDYFKLYMENDAVSFIENIVNKYGKETEVKVRFISPELPDSLSI